MLIFMGELLVSGRVVGSFLQTGVTHLRHVIPAQETRTTSGGGFK